MLGRGLLVLRAYDIKLADLPSKMSTASSLLRVQKFHIERAVNQRGMLTILSAFWLPPGVSIEAKVLFIWHLRAPEYHEGVMSNLTVETWYRRPNGGSHPFSCRCGGVRPHLVRGVTIQVD